ncbi:MAG TPA: hypothetical protein QF641_04025 [Candidatus Thalassarchaeaceae archaeon]|nr:hypothetical protein [Candidatus Thalassarchaeaceae archaeon]|tara:strand:- start:34430 stop:35404 length:975 start_codon:yes stop_codon:yes gene_type:complete
MTGNDLLADTLQHPRRSLGNRYRSQAEKFLRLAESDKGNLSWAEQNARQSVLYDFTNEENWKILVKIKVIIGDSTGTRAVLEDLFSVLGRNPENISQLDGIDLLKSSYELLEGALFADPLDPDLWWDKIGKDGEKLEDFSQRLMLLDVSDYRANILFTRRLERVRESGNEDLFLDLTRYLLAQRPNNHEIWEEIGRLYERRGEFDQAWFCYDQAQTHFPGCSARDRFRERMSGMADGVQGKAWKIPEISDRVIFLERMRKMASPGGKQKSTDVVNDEGPLGGIAVLRAEGKVTEAFFLARRLATEGVEGAELEVRQLLGEMNDE